MPLEKAFAIKAAPEAIWRALQSDLAAGDPDAFEVERTVPNELLSLWVEVQRGIRANLTYRLVPRAGHTEVVATMRPEGFRYALFRILTLGRADTNYEVLLVEGLANLKRAVEQPA
jgi:hypothetical protein